MFKENDSEEEPPPTSLSYIASSPETLQQRLAALNQVTMALTRSASIDELFQNAVKLGIQELGFDRLAFFLTEQNDPYSLIGTYGTDRQGQMVNEKKLKFRLASDHWLVKLPRKHSKALRAVMLETALVEPAERAEASDADAVEVVGTGWNAGAAAWDGQKIIGYLIADNLLRQQPFTDADGELLTLYAGTIGHLYLRLRVEHSLRDSYSKEHRFRTRLAKLNQIAAQLMRVPNLDDLYRTVIELGRGELGFDRLGLWLYGATPDSLVGTYGTWIDGTLKDERHLTMDAVILENKLAAQNNLGYGSSYTTGSPITTPETEHVGHGWSAISTLYDGDQMIGYLLTDNLLQQQPYDEMDGEMLTAYAHMIGPLITRQCIAEQLRNKQENYQALLDAIPDMLFVLTKDGVYQDYYAPDDTQLYTLPEHFIGKHVTDVLPPELSQKVLLGMEKVSRTGGHVTLEYTLPKQGELCFFDTRLVCLGNDSFLTLVRDVTDRKQLEEQLMVSQKMESMGRMASGIAHDFNNILTVIQGYSSLIQWQIKSGQPKLDNALAKMIDATEKGSRLTQRLLSFARKQIVAPKVIDVRTAIQEMVTMIRQILGDEINFCYEQSATPLLIKIDPGQFEQIVLNMTVNARDAMKPGDTFSIRCDRVEVDEADVRRHLRSASGNHVLIEFEDTGMGIKEELLKSIFEPFFTTKPSEEGSGLGLSICHSIVGQSGGHLFVESSHAVGTIFRVLLPITAAAAPQISGTDEHDHMLGGETILVVEDDPVICGLATDILRGQGYTVFHFTSSLDALRHIETHAGKIDLLVTDIMMPQMNGQELATATREVCPALPILMVSGYAGDLPDQFLESPNIEFLAKPYKATDLIAHVRSVLSSAGR